MFNQVRTPRQKCGIFNRAGVKEELERAIQDQSLLAPPVLPSQNHLSRLRRSLQFHSSIQRLSTSLVVLLTRLSQAILVCLRVQMAYCQIQTVN